MYLKLMKPPEKFYHATVTLRLTSSTTPRQGHVGKSQDYWLNFYAPEEKLQKDPKVLIGNMGCRKYLTVDRENISINRLQGHEVCSGDEARVSSERRDDPRPRVLQQPVKEVIFFTRFFN